MADNVPTIDYEQLARALMSEKHIGSPNPTAVYGHGPGGAFSSLGLSKPVFSALILPYMGLQGMLPAYPSPDSNPLRGIMTGVTTPTGSNPDAQCDDCKVAGKMKLCTQSVPFGRYCLDTPVFQVDRIGERRNRGEFTDLQLMNQAFGIKTPGVVPTTPQGSPLQNEMDKAMFEFAVSWGFLYCGQIWAGSPANNSQNGGYREFIGLDLQINTGHVDAETGVACPAADSIIRSAANREVNSNGDWYVRQITNICRNLQFIATRTGLQPARWALTMTWGLFYELTEIWPCSYMSYRCTTNDLNQATVQETVPSLDAAAMSKLRDDMRGDFNTMTGQFLLIDGQKWQVVIDDCIAETMEAGETFHTSIYWIPISVTGGTPVTYWEYFDFQGVNSATEIAQFAPDGSYFASDGGRFLWHRKPPYNWCVSMSALSKPRIVLETPYIAARMTNVHFTPIAHERDWDYGASYYVNGGQYQRDEYGPSYYEPVPR